MQYKNGNLFFSPSDLVNFTRSPFISWMDIWSVEDPSIKKLKDKPNAMLSYLAKKGGGAGMAQVNLFLIKYG